MAKQPVVGVTQSPMNAKRWCLTLACGHETWMTASRRPTTKAVECRAAHPESRRQLTLMTDPDFRRQPKTSSYCWYCQRDFKAGSKIREVFVIDGAMLLHPGYVEHHAADYPQPAGWCRVGADCAAKIGLEWTRVVSSKDGR